MLVVSTSRDHCYCEDFDPINLEEERVTYNETAWCDKLKRQRHRRRPDSCYAKNEQVCLFIRLFYCLLGC